MTGSVRQDFDRDRVQKEFGAIGLGYFLLKLIGRHFMLAPAVDQRHSFRAKPLRLRRGVDGGVASTDDGHAITDGYVMKRLAVNLLDEISRIQYFR